MKQRDINTCNHRYWEQKLRTFVRCKQPLYSGQQVCFECQERIKAERINKRIKNRRYFFGKDKRYILDMDTLKVIDTGQTNNENLE